MWLAVDVTAMAKKVSQLAKQYQKWERLAFIEDHACNVGSPTVVYNRMDSEQQLHDQKRKVDTEDPSDSPPTHLWVLKRHPLVLLRSRAQAIDN